MKVKPVEGCPGMLMFKCPGCTKAGRCRSAHHAVYAEPPGPHTGAKWGWNGSADKPTFTPSILVRSTDMTEKGNADYEAWIQRGGPAPEEGFDRVETVCHSFVTDGRIQFLGDCTHPLAGQTVDLPEWDE